MNVSMKWLISALALSLPFAVAAQSSDAKYCSDLSDRYERYLGQSLDRSPQPQSLDAKIAVGKCGAGETASTIPVLEKALRNGKIELPSRS